MRPSTRWALESATQPFWLSGSMVREVASLKRGSARHVGTQAGSESRPPTWHVLHNLGHINHPSGTQYRSTSLLQATRGDLSVRHGAR